MVELIVFDVGWIVVFVTVVFEELDCFFDVFFETVVGF